MVDYTFGNSIRYGDEYSICLYDFGFAFYKDGQYVIDGTKMVSEGSITIHYDKLPAENMVGSTITYRLRHPSLEQRVTVLEDKCRRGKSNATLEERVAYLEQQLR